jgi:peptidoglycan/LPS O-acetylase OafA/YrhL
MLSLERQWKDQGGKKFSVEFMIRRCFRIYPLSIAAVVLVVAFQLPLTGLRPGHLSVFRPDGGDVISNLFLVQNLTHRVSVLGPMWSLPYEMQMYLFLPWLFLLVCPNRSIGRIAAVWAFSIALGLVVMRHMPNPNLALFAPCFLPGVIAYQLQRKMRLRMPAFLWPPAVAALAAFFLAGASEENWPKKWAICLLLGLGIPIFSQLSARWFVMANHFIAKYSYGIYLTHFFCIWFAFERLAGLPAPERIIAFLLLAVGLPVLFYHAVEQPMIQVGKKLANTYAKAAHSPGAVAPMLAEPNVASPHY